MMMMMMMMSHAEPVIGLVIYINIPVYTQKVYSVGVPNIRNKTEYLVLTEYTTTAGKMSSQVK